MDPPSLSAPVHEFPLIIDNKASSDSTACAMDLDLPRSQNITDYRWQTAVKSVYVLASGTKVAFPSGAQPFILAVLCGEAVGTVINNRRSKIIHTQAVIPPSQFFEINNLTWHDLRPDYLRRIHIRLRSLATDGETAPLRLANGAQCMVKLLFRSFPKKEGKVIDPATPRFHQIPRSLPSIPEAAPEPNRPVESGTKKNQRRPENAPGVRERQQTTSRPRRSALTLNDFKILPKLKKQKACVRKGKVPEFKISKRIGLGAEDNTRRGQLKAEANKSLGEKFIARVSFKNKQPVVVSKPRVPEYAQLSAPTLNAGKDNKRKSALPEAEQQQHTRRKTDEENKDPTSRKRTVPLVVTVAKQEQKRKRDESLKAALLEQQNQMGNKQEEEEESPAKRARSNSPIPASPRHELEEGELSDD